MQSIGQCGEFNFKHSIHKAEMIRVMDEKCEALVLPIFGGSPGPKRTGYLALWDGE